MKAKRNPRKGCRRHLEVLAKEVVYEFARFGCDEGWTRCDYQYLRGELEWETIYGQGHTFEDMGPGMAILVRFKGDSTPSMLRLLEVPGCYECDGSGCFPLTEEEKARIVELRDKDLSDDELEVAKEEAFPPHIYRVMSIKEKPWLPTFDHRPYGTKRFCYVCDGRGFLMPSTTYVD